MRFWTFNVIVAGALLSAVSAFDDHDLPEDPRKSLNFGVIHPDGTLNIEETDDNCPFPGTLSPDPYDIARRHAQQLTQGIPYAEFVVRKDSYTDDTTGVSHVYLRQIIDGLEVADGDIQVNVANGRVLSWSNTVSPCF
jgi:extracellular elastinolytic metalloproteinase